MSSPANVRPAAANAVAPGGHGEARGNIPHLVRQTEVIRLVILVVGGTGSGKTEAMEALKGYLRGGGIHKSKKSPKPVTGVIGAPQRNGARDAGHALVHGGTIEFDYEGRKYILDFIDSRGFSDEHSQIFVNSKGQWETFLKQNNVTRIDLVLVFIHMDRISRDVLDDTNAMLEWFTDVLKMKASNMKFIINQSDFYSEQVIQAYLADLKTMKVIRKWDELAAGGQNNAHDANVTVERLVTCFLNPSIVDERYPEVREAAKNRYIDSTNRLLKLICTFPGPPHFNPVYNIEEKERKEKEQKKSWFNFWS